MIKGSFNVNETKIQGSFTSGGVNVINGGASVSYRERAPVYPGPYEVTPTRETQVLSTHGQKATDNITVHPIPPNYGLVTWDGFVLTIS